MLIEQIDLHNFMCYYGHNQFTFSDGLNLIIGDNGYGKSKLFDGFYWVMNDQIFDPEQKKFQPTSHVQEGIVSDKAIDNADEGEPVESYVSISFKDESKGHVFIITRTFSVIKEDKQIISPQESEEIVKQKDLGYLNAKIIENPVQVDKIKSRILPDNIKPYMWFQGEQVESIIDFNKSESLTQAINVLSNISRFDRVSEIANEIENSARKEYNKKLKSLSKDRNRSEELEKEYERLKSDIETEKKKEKEKKENLDRAEQRAEELLNKIDEAQQLKDLNKEKNETENQLQETLNEEKEKQINLQKKLFSSKWILKGCEPLLEQFSKLYDTYQTEKLRREEEKKAKKKAENELTSALKARLPDNVPEPLYLNKMLDREVCLVCNREAPKDSEPWIRIKELLTKREENGVEEDNESEGPIQNFDKDLKKLYQNGLALQPTISNIEQDINATLKDLDQTSQRRQELNNLVKDYDIKVQNLISESNLDVETAKNLTNEHQQNSNYAKRFREELNTIKNKIAKKSEEINNVKTELQSLSTGEFPEWLTEKMTVLSNFKQIAHSTRGRVFEELVKSLEEEANKHYYEMTKDNLSIRGYIKLKPSSGGNYMPSLEDEHGNQLNQLNTGNIILIKLATIMAIVSAKKGSRDTELYTLISDAPTSVFGEDYTIGFCKTISKVYKQSIIMSKEFYKNSELQKELFKNQEIKLGQVYMVTPTLEESERAERNKLATDIKAMN